MKPYEFAKLCQRMRSAQQRYLDAVRKGLSESVRSDTRTEARRQEYLVDELVYRCLHEPETAHLMGLAQKMRDAQKDWVRHRTRELLLQAKDAERRLDAACERVIAEHDTTPSLFANVQANEEST